MRKIGKINILVCVCLLIICLFTKSTVLAVDYYPEITDSGSSSSSSTTTGNKTTNSSKISSTGANDTVKTTPTPTPTKSTKQDTANTNHPQAGVFTNVGIGITLIITVVAAVVYVKYSKYNY